MRPAIPTSRRHLLCSISSLAASSLLSQRVSADVPKPHIRAVAFDALAIFDPRPVFELAKVLFPARGEDLCDTWRTHQFEYTWIRNSMQKYTDFWRVTHDALIYAGLKCGIEIDPQQSARLMSAYLQLQPYPDVVTVLEKLRARGLRLALLSNFTVEMMRSSTNRSALGPVFDFLLSTDQVRRFKPDPVAYALATQAFHLERGEIAFAAFGSWDAAGAKAFGFPTYWTNRNSLPMDELGARPDAVCSDLSQLLDFTMPSRR